MYNNHNQNLILSKDFSTSKITNQKSTSTQQPLEQESTCRAATTPNFIKTPAIECPDNMSSAKPSWSAKFIGYEILNGNIHYRRLYFKNVRSENGVIIKEDFFIDESKKLKAIGPLYEGETISFTADKNLKNIRFCYPHGKLKKKIT